MGDHADDAVEDSLASYYYEQSMIDDDEYAAEPDDFEPTAPKHDPAAMIRSNLDRLVRGSVETFEVPTWLRHKKGWRSNFITGRVTSITSKGVAVLVSGKTEWLPLGWVKVKGT